MVNPISGAVIDEETQTLVSVTSTSEFDHEYENSMEKGEISKPLGSLASKSNNN